MIETTKDEVISAHDLDESDLKELLNDLLKELGFEITKAQYSQPILRKKETA